MIAIDEVLRRTTKSAHLSPLAVGLGIYLPTQSTLMVVVGAVVGWWFDRRADRGAKPEATKQLGVLLASGMIVGEGLVGVVVAALVAFSDKLGFANRDFPLNLVSDNYASAPWLGGFSQSAWVGGAAFALVMFVLYRWVERLGQRSA
jgi:hypothetical protein